MSSPVTYASRFWTVPAHRSPLTRRIAAVRLAAVKAGAR